MRDEGRRQLYRPHRNTAHLDCPNRSDQYLEEHHLATPQETALSHHTYKLLRHLTYRQTRWVPDPTVSHPERGLFLIRLPGMATTALPHVQPVGDETADCVVSGAAPAGPDLTVDIRCATTRTGLPDVVVTVAEPRPDDGPTLLVGPGVQTVSTGTPGPRHSHIGRRVHRRGHRPDLRRHRPPAAHSPVHRANPLRHPLPHPGHDAARPMHPRRQTGRLPLALDVHPGHRAHRPDHHDPHRRPDDDLPPRHLRPRLTLTEVNLGDYLLTAPSAANPRVFPLYDTLATATQPGIHCSPLGWNASTPHAAIRCVDASGPHTWTSFSAIYLRRP